MEQRSLFIRVTDSPLSLPAVFSKPTKECLPDSRVTLSLAGTSSGAIGGLTPRQRFQSGSSKLLASVSDSMQALMSLRRKTSGSSKEGGSDKSSSGSGNQKTKSGEGVRTLVGVRHGLRDEGEISREGAAMRRWIEELIDAGQENEMFPDAETIMKEMDEIWGKGKGKAL